MIIYDSEGRKVLDVTVDDNSYRSRIIMGDNSITLHYSLAEHVEVPVGAYCEFENARYTLMRPENLKMKHSRYFEYTVILEGPEAKSKIWKFRNTVDSRLKFSLTAKPREHLQMLVDNMNRRDSGWTVGDCVEGPETLINYDHVFCYDALAQMASEFKTEFEFAGKRVSLHKVEYNKNNPLPLSYGRGNGFKPNVGRSNYGDNVPVEILFVQGGSDNIDRSKYPVDEKLRAISNGCLLLPINQTLRFDGEFFEDEEGFNPDNARTYLSDGYGLSIRRADKELNSLAEDSLDCSAIYPKRVGTISAVEVVDSENNFYDIIDNTIPGDLNYEDYLIAGESMTVIFQSGMLAGKEFEVKYVHEARDGKAARRFEIVPQEIDGQTMPNSIFAPAVADTYAVFNCMLPDAYICDNGTKTGASWDMFREAVRYMFDNEEAQFSFTGELDGQWSKRDWVNIGGRIKLGGYIKFSDENFQKEGVLVRITGIKDYINNPHSPELTLSNTTVTGGFGTTLQDLKSEEVMVEDYHRSAIQYTKRRFRDAKETISMLEDALLNNFTGTISPIAVQTMSMLVGDESLQFVFVRSLSDPTEVSDTIRWDNVTKQLTIDASIIQHRTIGIKDISSSHTGQFKMWSLPPYTSAILTDGSKRYYLYAKCSKNGQTGDFMLSETAVALEGVPGYYHLLVGILNSEYDGERSFATLYGFTEVLPGRITTDRIVSGSGDSFFDMLNNAMKLGNMLDFNSKGDGKLRLRGTIIQSESGAESLIGVYRGVYNSDYTYYNGDEVSYTVSGVTSTYRYIGSTPGKNIPPTESTYWQVHAAGVKGDKGDKGEDGNDGLPGTYYEYRYAKNGSTTIPPDLNKQVLAPKGWDTVFPVVGDLEYLWMTVAKISGDGNELLSEWSTPVRFTPKDGQDGKQGYSPALVFRGQYNASDLYYGNQYRVDAVKYGNTYFVARVDAGTFSGVLPSDTSKWNSFGATFESVATNLLLAENANIAGWIFRNNRLESQDGTIWLDGVKGQIMAKGGFSGILTAENLFMPFVQIMESKTLQKSDPTNIILHGHISQPFLTLPDDESFNGMFLNICLRPLISRMDAPGVLTGKIMCPDKGTVVGGYIHEYYASLITSKYGGIIQLLNIDGKWILLNGSNLLEYTEYQ